eukprot:5761126-Pleurochrysis_carterae.AAC.1
MMMRLISARGGFVVVRGYSLQVLRGKVSWVSPSWHTMVEEGDSQGCRDGEAEKQDEKETESAQGRDSE